MNKLLGFIYEMSMTQNLVAIENHRIPKSILTDEINTNDDMRHESFARTGEAITYNR